MPEAKASAAGHRRTRRSSLRPGSQPTAHFPAVIVPDDTSPVLNWIVQHEVHTGWETLLDVAPGSLRVRRIFADGTRGPWRRRRLGLRRPHSTARLSDGALVVADTGNNRLVWLRHPAGELFRERRRIGGHSLRQPHDVHWNPVDGFLYVVDASRLYRLRSAGDRGEAWTPRRNHLGYARALCLLDGRMHVVASSLGTVIRIDNFRHRRATRFAAPGKRKVAPAGTWHDTGLILNDVAQLDGWYYGTNYFSPDYARRGDARSRRFIRWRTWKDFSAGRWTDLSRGFAAGMIPYFITGIGSRLHVAAFCHANHSRDGIFCFDPAREM